MPMLLKNLFLLVLLRQPTPRVSQKTPPALPPPPQPVIPAQAGIQTNRQSSIINRKFEKAPDPFSSPATGKER
jgi:hypothetical protein